jgi:hypothetical protein
VLALALFGLAPTGALATHCPPDHPPHPPGVPDDYPCPQPATPTPKPATPKPATPKPATPAPTRYVAPAPVQQPVTQPDSNTPEPTAFPIEVTSPSPDAATEVVVEPDQLTAETPLKSEDAASASSWIFGFIVGLIIGGLIGRASWGLRRRRRQQIFG